VILLIKHGAYVDMIRTSLMGHQVKISEFARVRKAAGIFADYGTGKTLAALDIVDKARLRRVLVVSTKLSVQSTWPSEIRQHSNFRWVVLVGSRRKKGRLLQYGMRASHVSAGPYNAKSSNTVLFLVNYDGVKNIYREITTCKWDAIILDESTKIKSPHTMRTKVLWDIGKRIPRRYIMTGFPVTENIADLYAQVKFLDDTNMLGSSYYAFINTYFVKVGMKTLPRRKMVKELIDKISTFCIRVSNKSLKLPPVIYKPIEIEMTAKQKQLLAEFKSTYKLELGKVKIDTQYIFALISKSLQICDGYVQDDKGNVETIPTNKDEALIETLDEMDAKHNKVVIWAAFRFSINKIRRILTRLGYGVLGLTGATEDPELVIKRFQHDKRYTILLATQKKAAESVTLTASKFAIYYSNHWSYDLRANSEARIRRKGSEKHSSITYVDFVTKNTVETKVYDCLRKKKNLITELKSSFKEVG
jgi:SNF2 family DNA or RNA helicase